MKEKLITAIIMLMFFAATFSNYITVFASVYDLKTYEDTVDYTLPNVVYDNKNFKRTDFLVNSIKDKTIDMLANDDGTFTICIEPENNKDENYIYIREYDKNMTCTKTLRIQKYLSEYGSFAKDDKGNYYMFYGSGKKVETNNLAKNMVLVKYNSEGIKLRECYFNEPYNSTWGVKKPKIYKSKMNIIKDKLLICFGRDMYKDESKKSNQSSYAVLFDLVTFTNISNSSIFSIKSLNRDLISEEEGFIALDVGYSNTEDKYPNAFKLSKFFSNNVTSSDVFSLKDNNYISELGGFSKTKTGYIICGTYKNSENEKSSSNIFLQIVSSDMDIKSDPVFITDYSDKSMENALNPKIIYAGSGKYILLWENLDGLGNYKGTYMAMVNNLGVLQGSIKKLDECRLNSMDNLIYSSNSNKIYWATNSNNKIVIYELDPGEDAFIEEIPCTKLILDKSSIELTEGHAAELFYSFEPEDTTDRDIIWESEDKNIASIDENGKITVNKEGAVNIIAKVKGREDISATCLVKVLAHKDETNNTKVETDTAEITDTTKEKLTNKNKKANNTQHEIVNNTNDATQAPQIINTTETEVITPKPSNNVDSKANTFEERVIELCNEERQKNGLSPLTENSKLMELSRMKSEDMAINNYFSHTSPTYGDTFKMMETYGVTYANAGENIAAGQQTPEDVVKSWMNSEGHRANILSPDFNNIGVGMATNQKGDILWTQQFIKK